MSAQELAVLVDQLDEMLSSGVDDADDALEIASVAGMIARLEPRHPSLAGAVAWREDAGADLLAEAWEDLDVDELVASIDALVAGNPTEDEVEEAVLDFDELVAAAAWCGRSRTVVPFAVEVERTVRMVPEVFAPMAPFGLELARLPEVAQQLDLYGFWLAIADAGAHEL
ncbi:MAG: hypothetical protein H6733_14070 [Alphaproteobacteria bacterium]|nr:hypothetical protein [Alphaproteobacteria bacterium]